MHLLGQRASNTRWGAQLEGLALVSTLWRHLLRKDQHFNAKNKRNVKSLRKLHLLMFRVLALPSSHVRNSRSHCRQARVPQVIQRVYNL